MKTNTEDASVTSGGSQTTTETDSLDLLPMDFVPGDWDVICQRGRESYDHVGNKAFRMIIDAQLEYYMGADSRQHRSRIVTTIISSIRSAAAGAGGGFVRKDLLTRRWSRVGDKVAREKVGQALRDAVKTRRATAKKPIRSLGNSVPSNNTMKGMELQEQINNKFELEGATSTAGQTIGDNLRDLVVNAIGSSKPLQMNLVGSTGVAVEDAPLPGLQGPQVSSWSQLGEHTTASGIEALQQPATLRLGNVVLPTDLEPSALRFGSKLSAELEPVPIQKQPNVMVLPGLLDIGALRDLSVPTIMDTNQNNLGLL